MKNLNLNTPQEPPELRAEIKRLRDCMAGPGVDWDPLAVWYGNKIPKYLWAQWKDELKPYGFTWQAFLKLLRFRTDGAVLWFLGKRDWKEFVEDTKVLLSGPLGELVSKR